jgi:hypothetical protein
VNPSQWATKIQQGRRDLTRNTTTVAFQNALQEWELKGWIRRTPTHVEAVDRPALKDLLAELEGQQPRPRRSIAENERTARRAGLLATCSFWDYRPEMGRQVRISLSRPKYPRIEPDDSLWDLTPHPSYFRAAPQVFDRRYLAQLDRVGVNRLLEQFQHSTTGGRWCSCASNGTSGPGTIATEGCLLSFGWNKPARSSRKSPWPAVWAVERWALAVCLNEVRRQNLT